MGILLRVGMWVLSAWGVTEIASEAGENVEEVSENLKKSAKNVGITIVVVSALFVVVTWLINRPKKNRKR